MAGRLIVGDALPNDLLAYLDIDGRGVGGGHHPAAGPTSRLGELIAEKDATNFLRCIPD